MNRDEVKANERAEDDSLNGMSGATKKPNGKHFHDDGKASEQDVLDGITVDDLNAEVRKQYEIPANVKGVIITEVDPNSVAYEAGLREGNVIQEIDRKPVKNAEEAVAMSDLKGKSVLLRVWSRGGSNFVVVKPDNEKAG